MFVAVEELVLSKQPLSHGGTISSVETRLFREKTLIRLE